MSKVNSISDNKVNQSENNLFLYLDTHSWFWKGTDFFPWGMHSQTSNTVRKTPRHQIQKSQQLFPITGALNLPEAIYQYGVLMASWVRGDKDGAAFARKSTGTEKPHKLRAPEVLPTHWKDGKGNILPTFWRRWWKNFCLGFKSGRRQKKKSGPSWEFSSTALPLCGFEV